MQRPATVVLERDPPGGQLGDDALGVGREDTAEEDACREHEDVRSETVPPDVRRLPHGVTAGMRAKRVEHGCPEPRAARIPPAVAADEQQRAIDRPAAFEVGRRGEPAQGATVLPRFGDECERLFGTPVGTANQLDASVEPVHRGSGFCGQPGLVDVPRPGPRHLEQEPLPSLGRRSRE